MSDPLIVVIDQGTFSTRAMALDRNGKVQASAFCKIALHRKGSARVEQNADEIIRSVNVVLQKVMSGAMVKRRGVYCAGLATQRSSVVAWDKRNGRPLGPLLSWQDRRAAKWLSRFNTRAGEIQQRTGLPLSPHYGASKLHWYLDHLPAVKQAHKQGHLVLGPLASFILSHLLQRQPVLVDHANASRTQLWNIHTRNWDPWLSKLFGVPFELLPDCMPTCHNYGVLKTADFPITAVNGDQTSAIYSLGKPPKDTAIVNLGTGAFVLLSTGSKLIRHSTLLSGLAMSSANKSEYIIEGTVNGAGAALDWASKQWKISDITQHLSEWLLRNSEPPIFVNTVGGLGSPWWRSGPAPSLLGKGEPWQKTVAVAESILFLLQANLDTILRAGLTVGQLRVSGGLARIDGMCQRLADLSRKIVYRPAETEATARGIAWLASGCPLHWPKPGRGRVFKPRENHPLINRYQRFLEILEK